MKRFLEEAKKLIRTNSETSNGNEELASYVSSLMRESGLRVQLQQVTHSLEDVSKRQFNVIGILGDHLVDKKIRKGLLLNTHLDTVSPGLKEHWSETGGDPFSAVVKGNKIFGLGSADVKLDLLCKLYAVRKFREKKLKMPVYLVGTCGEELGMFGARYLIKSMALNPKYVVVGEPSELKVVYAHKCLNIYRVTIGYQQVERDARGFNRRVTLFSYGKSAHASYPHMGINAIESAVDFLKKASARGFEFRFTHFDGGDTVNRVPDRAKVEFFLTSHQFEDFKRFFREISSNPDGEESGDGFSGETGEGKESYFKAELGGVGDAGVRFLPEVLFPCLSDINGFFRGLAQEFGKVKDDSYNPASSTLNFGKLKQQPGSISMHLDLRLLPDLMPEEIEKHILKEMQAIAAKYPSLNITAVKERINPGLNMTTDHELVKICRDAMAAANLEPVLSKKATSTEAAQYFQAGYEAVVFGPGVSHGNSHSPNEHNLLDHLEKATHFYEKLIEKVCT
jgi:succinyl-diaminopimelate desuccinylase